MCILFCNLAMAFTFLTQQGRPKGKGGSYGDYLYNKIRPGQWSN